MKELINMQFSMGEYLMGLMTFGQLENLQKMQAQVIQQTTDALYKAMFPNH